MRTGESTGRRLVGSLALAVALAVAGSGCATAGLIGRGPEDQREAFLEMLQRQLDALGTEGIAPASPGLAGRQAVGDPASPPPAGPGPEGGGAPGQTLDPVPQGLERPPGINRTYTLVNGFPEYRIGPGDLLQIAYFIGPESTVVRTRVQSDGTIFVRLFDIGSLEVAGRSPTQVRDLLVERLAEFVPNAHAEVEVEEYRAWTATLLGEIRGEGSGEYPLKGRTTVMEFIFDHGGATQDANLSAVRLIRDGTPIALDLLAAMLRGRSEHNPVLDAGDVVFVPSRFVGGGRIFVLGEVRNPGVFTFLEGMTVLDAIALAGSFTDLADPRATFIARYDEAEHRVVGVDVGAIVGLAEFERNIPLQERDFVVVPRQGGLVPFFRRVAPVFDTILDIAIIFEILRRQ